MSAVLREAAIADRDRRRRSWANPAARDDSAEGRPAPRSASSPCAVAMMTGSVRLVSRPKPPADFVLHCARSKLAGSPSGCSPTGPRGSASLRSNKPFTPETRCSRLWNDVSAKSDVHVRDHEAEVPRAADRFAARLQEIRRRQTRAVDRKRYLPLRVADVVLIMQRDQRVSQARLRSCGRRAGRGEIVDGEIYPFRLTPVGVFASDLGA